MNLNSFPIHQIGHDDDDHNIDQHSPIFGPNSSSSLSSCRIFFNSSQDHMMGCYDDHHRHQLYRPQHKTDINNYDYFGGPTTYEIKNDAAEGRGLKLTLWKKEEDHDTNNPVKWMSSKMRLMQKMNKYPDRTAMNITSTTKAVDDDHDEKMAPSSSMETDMSSNSASSCYNNSPVRVCADCNTTKTPLWRSGPRGPKSLCNACGIRQRKARRAMAAAAANGMAEPPPGKIKVQHKEKAAKIGNASQIKKRCKSTGVAAASMAVGSTQQKKICVEDFLISLSKKLSFHRVFPEDEKDAAILLMALSSGLVHG